MEGENQPLEVDIPQMLADLGEYELDADTLSADSGMDTSPGLPPGPAQEEEARPTSPSLTVSLAPPTPVELDAAVRVVEEAAPDEDAERSLSVGLRNLGLTSHFQVLIYQTQPDIRQFLRNTRADYDGIYKNLAKFIVVFRLKLSCFHPAYH